jgi:hypothetical protein
MTSASLDEQATYPSGRTSQIPPVRNGGRISESSNPSNLRVRSVVAAVGSAHNPKSGAPPDPTGTCSTTGMTRSPGLGPALPCSLGPLRGLSG